MINSKRSIIVFALGMTIIALMLTACGGGDATVDQGPVIKLVVGDQTYEAKPYFYCWPQSADDTQCDLNEAIKHQPEQIAQVNATDEVRFVIDGESQAPTSFVAHLLDGSQAVQNLGTGQEAVYNAAYEDGLYRVQIDVEYADIDGQPANVSYVYGLQISGKVVVVVPTATPTALPTAIPTATTTPTVTPTTTPTSTPEPTVIPTSANPALAEARSEHTALFAGPGDDTGRIGIIEPGDPYAVVGRSGDWVQLEYAGSPNNLAWVLRDDIETKGNLDSVVEVNPAEVPTMAANVLNPQLTAVAMAQEQQSAATTPPEMTAPPEVTTQESTALPVATTTPQAAAALPIVTATAIATATATPFTIATAQPTEAAASATPIPPVVTAVVQQTLPKPLPEEVPAMALVVGGRVYSPLGYRYCQRAASGERACIELPTDAANTQRFTLFRGDAAQLQIIGERPNEVRIEYLTDTGIATGQPETRAGDNLVLFVISPEAGSYIMSVRFTWPSKEATYFFRVAISG